MRVGRVHFQPRTRRHFLQDGNGSRLGTRVPMLNRSAGIQHKRKLLIRLLGEGSPLRGNKPRPSIAGWEISVAVKPPGRSWILAGVAGKRPLDTAEVFDDFVGHSRVVAEPPCRYPAPLFECVRRLAPARKQFLAAAKLFREGKEYLEIRTRFRRRVYRS